MISSIHPLPFFYHPRKSSASAKSTQQRRAKEDWMLQQSMTSQVHAPVRSYPVPYWTFTT